MPNGHEILHPTQQHSGGGDQVNCPHAVAPPRCSVTKGSVSPAIRGREQELQSHSSSDGSVNKRVDARSGSVCPLQPGAKPAVPSDGQCRNNRGTYASVRMQPQLYTNTAKEGGYI